MNMGSIRVLHMGCGESLLGVAHLAKHRHDRNTPPLAKCKSIWRKPERRPCRQR